MNKRADLWMENEINETMVLMLDECMMPDKNMVLFTSLPTGIPLPRPAVRPITLAMKALRVRYSFRTTPLRMVFSSGIPEPVNKTEEKHRRIPWKILEKARWFQLKKK